MSERPGQSKVSLSTVCRRIPSANDSDRNRSSFKKGLVAFSISLLTFSIYIGLRYLHHVRNRNRQRVQSLPSQSNTRPNTLHPSLQYRPVLTPLQEMASYGRDPAYTIGLAIFVLFNVPIVVSHNLSVVIAFRFFTGFVGSPALTAGGASMADIFPGGQLPYVIDIWALGAVGGPILHPVIVSLIYTLNLYIIDTTQRADS